MIIFQELGALKEYLAYRQKIAASHTRRLPGG